MNLTVSYLEPDVGWQHEHRRLLLGISGAVLLAGAVALAIMATVGRGRHAPAPSWVTPSQPTVTPAAAARPAAVQAAVPAAVPVVAPPPAAAPRPAPAVPRASTPRAAPRKAVRAKPRFEL